MMVMKGHEGRRSERRRFGGRHDRWKVTNEHNARSGGVFVRDLPSIARPGKPGPQACGRPACSMDLRVFMVKSWAVNSAI
jgi:hypothetical protein